MEVDTVDELKNLVGRDESKGRTKFVVKIFHMLQFVRKHPEKMLELGASWCNDGRHFVINSNILGSFLGLKANSVNTNFRDHGFQIISSNAQDLRSEFSNMIETRHWKKRISGSSSFTINSNIDDAENIPCLQQRVDNAFVPSSADYEKEVPFMPKETITLLAEDQSQLLNIYRMYYSHSYECNYFKTFLSFVTNLWKTQISELNYANSTKIISVIVGENPQLEVNLDFILQQRDESSQSSEIVTFDSFVKYFMRYGDSTDLSLTLREVSCITPQPPAFDIDGFNVFPSQNYDQKVQFNDWFSPFADKNHALTVLKKQIGEAWLLIPSKTPNQFTLLYKDDSYDFNVQALHILHNPIPPDTEHRYGVQFHDGTYQYRSTLDLLFTDVLKLAYRGVSDVETLHNRPKYVSADDIANRKKPEQVLPNLESQIGEQPEFQQPEDSQFWYLSSQFNCSQVDTQVAYPDSFHFE
ncbi:hypothetical protein TRFO_13496 [Tritrichomonas foetus]|uniref:Initiator binding domain-containing protein n=1 Tax=Tritrichomonas foetus TaxID=1144522 RepID=A0A1J4KXQ2_9EUKA|nr:hypothetical protein TRFO_13496 [Tritrichomonas foetus]|eukprot:OHT16015.1 hypothetical protein TRFO_13496 [Tritrichomonas foetus]